MKSHRFALVGGAAALLVACASSPPPRELVDARAELAKARSGPAQQLAPAQLHVAQEELQLAESACNDDCSSVSTQDHAYLALRKTQLAEAQARVGAAVSNQAQAGQSVQLTQAQMAINTKAALVDTRAQLAQAQMQTQAAMADLALIAATRQDDRGLIITLSGSVLFATNKDALLGSADTKLDQIAEALQGKLRGHSMEVQGYTDSQGSDDHNVALSQRRAESVRAYLVSRGISPERIVARGYGKDRPVADNATPDGRADNRRVEIVVRSDAPASN